MNYRWAYQNSGGPPLSWKHGPPRQTRAADTVALGSLGDPTIELPLPRPGAPEPIGCACDGGRDIIIDIASPSFLVGAAVGYFLLTKLFKRQGP
jgi:hypothetical protein